MYNVTVDFERTVGNVKAFHGINNAPIMGTNTSLYPCLGAAGIPYSRLHDTGGIYGGGRFVDIANIFRNFDADVNDPASYDFAFTDWLLEQITKQGTDIIFRLGASIENGHRIKAYYIYPPKDNLKWAKICEGIINHYNNGWANGFYYNIKYWEIWNEPDNEPEIEDNPMWKGTKEQFFELYTVTANYLKNKFPDIKVGGYASCGFYALEEGVYVKTANSSPRTEYFIEFFHDFMKHISSQDGKAPLDFFSWHSYASSDCNRQWSFYVKEQLLKYGFGEAEIMLNEWNPGRQYRGTEADACYILDMLLTLHDCPIDIMTYYDGQVNSGLGGLFNPLTIGIFPAYYALHSFNELYQLKNAVYTENDGLVMLAASNNGVGKILLSNTSDKEIEVCVSEKNQWKNTGYRILDGINGLVTSSVHKEHTFSIPAMKIAIIEYCK